jgi:hypothetical protein
VQGCQFVKKRSWDRHIFAAGGWTDARLDEAVDVCVFSGSPALWLTGRIKESNLDDPANRDIANVLEASTGQHDAVLQRKGDMGERLVGVVMIEHTDSVRHSRLFSLEQNGLSGFGHVGRARQVASCFYILGHLVRLMRTLSQRTLSRVMPNSGRSLMRPAEDLTNTINERNEARMHFRTKPKDQGDDPQSGHAVGPG